MMGSNDRLFRNQYVEGGGGNSGICGRGGGDLLRGFTVRNQGRVFMELGRGGINLHGTMMS